MIPKCKTGDCSKCGAKDTSVVKIAKDLFCLSCNREIKSKKYAAKTREANKVRGLVREQDVLNRGIKNDYNALNTWFMDRRKEMTGRCSNCGKQSCKIDEKYYKHSIAHILPKAYFKSVATHPDNFIELCFWGDNSCHTNMDNHTLDLIDMNCFAEIVDKVVKMYPHIATEERRRIPPVLMEYIKTDL